MLRFISDVQINALDQEPETIATQIQQNVGNKHFYDCGDLVEHGSFYELTEYGIYRSIMQNTTPVPGNHDHYDGLNNWVGPTDIDTYAEGVHIVGFDTGNATQEKLNELSNKLNEDANFTILYMHHHLFSDNIRTGELASFLRSIYLDIIENSKTTMVVTGHGHAYERHVYNGRPYLVIGGGGAPLDEVGYSDTQIMSASTHHWLEVQPMNSCLHCEVKNLSNEVIDSFNVYPRNPVDTGKTPYDISKK